MPRARGRGRGKARQTSNRGKKVVNPRKPRWCGQSDEEEVAGIETGVLTRNRSKRKFSEAFRSVLEAQDDDEELSISELSNSIRNDESDYEESINFDSTSLSPESTLFSFEDIDEQSIPDLDLPTSCTDLLVNNQYILQCLEIYEVLWRFKTILRLSPFRFEDFLMALSVSENSILLSEIHIMIFKAILREEESTNTIYGPQDAKDSINICFYFNDNVTWPEVIRSYMESRNEPHLCESINILSKDCYSETNISDRLTILRALIDLFLIIAAVRIDLSKINDEIRHEEHCRLCFKGGDLICCDRCSAVYHLECTDPPLTQVPQGEWLCSICQLSLVTGVTDCLSFERLRQEPLGFDRHKRHFWILSRRLIVESGDGDVRYYSSSASLKEIFSRLDSEKYEKRLYSELKANESFLVEQMESTKLLTEKLKIPKNCQSILNNEIELFNSIIEKRLQNVCITEKNENKSFSECKSELMEINSDGKTIIENTYNDKIKNTDIECKNLEKCIDEIPDFSQIDDIDAPMIEHRIVTRSKTGSLTPRVFTDSVPGTRLQRQQRQFDIPPLPPRQPGSPFKLGMEGTYRQYINHANSSDLALTKQQNQEERDKRRHLSHKFSLTTVSHFSWNGTTFSNCDAMIKTLRCTIEQFESSFPSVFMHHNWTTHRQNWLRAINMCVTPKDFALALAILEACIKPVVLLTVWNEHVGHYKLIRQTQAIREEKKKRKREEDDYFTKTAWIKNSKGFRHQVWKQKGEEYRLYWGCYGWYWISITRRKKIVHFHNTDISNSNKQNGPTNLEYNSHNFNYDNIVREKLEDILSTIENSENTYSDKVKSTQKIYQTNDVIDVVNGLRKRICYPVIKKSISKLDMLLDRREKQTVNSIRHRNALHFALSSYKKAQELGNLKKRGFSQTCYSVTCGDVCYSPTCNGQEIDTVETKTDSNDLVAYVTTPNGKRVTVDSKLACILEKRISQYNFDTKLKVKCPSAPNQCKKKRGHLPVVQKFSLHGHRSILLGDKFELRKLAKDFTKQLQGFHYGSKTTPEWIYPCPRPLFSTCWRFRLTGCKSLAACALQLRVLWCCIRWDDLDSKPVTASLTRTVSTDTDIITTELLKKRNCGVYGLKSEYLQRKIIVPIGGVSQPRDEYTPIRSGLRERRRVASPKQKEPLISEEWVGEEELELWQIKLFSEHRVQSKNRSNDVIVKLEEKKAEIVQGKTTASEITQSPRTSANTPMQTHRPLAPRSLTMPSPNILSSNNAQHKNPTSKLPILPTNYIPKPVSSNSVTISRDTSGKICVRGLLPDQQLIRLSDGRYAIQNKNSKNINVLQAQSTIKSPQIQQQNIQSQPLLTKGQPSSSLQKSPVIVQKPQQVQFESSNQQPQLIIKTSDGHIMRAQFALKNQQQQSQLTLKSQVHQTTHHMLVNYQQSQQLNSTPVRLISNAPNPASLNFVRSQLIRPAKQQIYTTSNTQVSQQHPIQAIQISPKIQQTSTQHLTNNIKHVITTTPVTSCESQVTIATTDSKVVSSNDTKNDKKEDKFGISSAFLQQMVRSALEQTSDPEKQAKLTKMQNTLTTKEHSTKGNDCLKYNKNSSLSERQKRLLESSSSLNCQIKRIQQCNTKSKQKNSSIDEIPVKHNQVKKTQTSQKKKALRRENKLYCICKTPYDDGKFYIGCDLCSNWFHGNCVGIREDEAKAIDSFVCDECRLQQNKTQSDLYCLCKKPYDSSLFYIGCDRCQDWFHGECVGVSKSEADELATYICPRCQSAQNGAKQLSDDDYTQLEILFKQLKSHRLAWPFKEAVNAHEVPDYYKVIKDPIDFKMIQERLNKHHYSILDEFNTDVMRVFHNCRTYNSSSTPYYACADAVEKFFVQKIKPLQQKMQ